MIKNSNFNFRFFQDDYRVCLANGVLKKGGDIPCPVDASGSFTEEVKDFKNQYVKVSSQQNRGNCIENGQFRQKKVATELLQ